MKKKQKLRKSLTRRIKITATGKVLHGRSFKRHLRRNKSASQKRKMNKLTSFSSAWDKKIKKYLGVAV